MAQAASGLWWYRQYYGGTEESVPMDVRMELAASEVQLELTDGRRAVITVEVHEGAAVLVLGEGVEATLLRGLVQQQRT